MARSRNATEVEEMVNSSDSRADLNTLPSILDKSKLIPTGSTLLNLALSDNPYGGFYLGTINNIIGDSAAGKTFLAWTVFAEMVYDRRFGEYDLYYDEPEASLAFDINKLFGKAVEDRVILDRLSGSVEDFHDHVMSLLEVDKKKSVKPFVYCLDSLDAICTEDEIERDIRKGTFGGQKPKLISEILRKIVQNLKGTNSTVFVISQTRDNIGVSFGDKKTRSGGKALKFFSTHELWLAVKGHIKRKERDVGVEVKVKISKNKLTGKLRTIEFPIYYDYGIDDIYSCIAFLIAEGRWSESKKVIDTKGDFGEISYKLNALIEHIENNDLKSELVRMVAETWYDIETSIATNRRKKYEIAD